MAYDEQLAERIRRVLGNRRDFTERRMFGGLAFLYRGRMCCGIVGNDLAVRGVDDEFEAALRRQHVRPMDFAGRPLRGFVYVSPPGVRSAAALRSWLARGERVATEKSAVANTRRKPRSHQRPGKSRRAS